MREQVGLEWAIAMQQLLIHFDEPAIPPDRPPSMNWAPERSTIDSDV